MTFRLSGIHGKKGCVEYTIYDFEQANILGETIGKARIEQKRVQKCTMVFFNKCWRNFSYFSAISGVSKFLQEYRFQCKKKQHPGIVLAFAKKASICSFLSCQCLSGYIYLESLSEHKNPFSESL